MTLQQLRYVLEVANCRSITEAAQNLFITQPSLSAAVHDLERETGVTIFTRGSRGVLVTPEGEELLSYARQVVQQAALMEDRYITHSADKKRFAVSTQHYSFTAGAFVQLVREETDGDYEFTLREGRTLDTIHDVQTHRSEMGVIYISSFNENVLMRRLREAGIVFNELFSARPHIFIGRSNPLAGRASVALDDLKDLPCLSYDQGEQSAAYFAEEILSTMEHSRMIRVTDKGSIIDLMTGTDGYTIASGLCPSYLRGDSIVSIPLEVDEVIRIGVITRSDYRPTPLGEKYLALLHGLVSGSRRAEEKQPPV